MWRPWFLLTRDELSTFVPLVPRGTSISCLTLQHIPGALLGDNTQIIEVIKHQIHISLLFSFEIPNQGLLVSTYSDLYAVRCRVGGSARSFMFCLIFSFLLNIMVRLVC